jgi:hypothetical protein
MKLRHALLALAAAGLSVSASAQTLKPGLWQVANRMQGGSIDMERATQQMEQQMRTMKPEQRKMMEEMLAKQGIKTGPGGLGLASVQMCMTKEMVERNEVPAQQGDCRTTQHRRSGNTVRIAYTCTKPPSSGEGTLIIHSPEAYTMKMAITRKGAAKAETVHMDASGKWLKADCGNVKPIQAPLKK